MVADGSVQNFVVALLLEASARLQLVGGVYLLGGRFA